MKQDSFQVASSKAKMPWTLCVVYILQESLMISQLDKLRLYPLSRNSAEASDNLQGRDKLRRAPNAWRNLKILSKNEHNTKYLKKPLSGR